MITLKEYKSKLLTRGKTHTIIINDVTYTLTINTMLIMCKWSLKSASGSNMFSNVYTLDDVANYIRSIGNKLNDTDDGYIHHHVVINDLMFLISDDNHVAL